MMRAVLWVILALDVLGFFGSFLLEASFDSRAQLIQVVRANPGGLRNGGQGYTDVGPPEKLILDDPRAFLPGYGDNGARLADEAYLSREGIHPLHPQTVEVVGWFARAGCAVTLLLAAAGLRAWRDTGS